MYFSTQTQCTKTDIPLDSHPTFNDGLTRKKKRKILILVLESSILSTRNSFCLVGVGEYALKIGTAFYLFLKAKFTHAKEMWMKRGHLQRPVTVLMAQRIRLPSRSFLFHIPPLVVSLQPTSIPIPHILPPSPLSFSILLSPTSVI
ncbi:hypothetical protein CEXT_332981 [Caerostris extrusa]|uniref:Uncharacterized protein n=1 Tax=Caerostris extrusa TaxID=172846 RepID=A0AAV4TN46_CAEEX|nr:hypothetical protein CEXT_332981 [Caerostris extrusa]